jgi:hypothetical protein
MIQETYETGIGKEKGRSVFYLMMMSDDKILYQWKMNIVQTTGAMTLAQKTKIIKNNLSHPLLCPPQNPHGMTLQHLNCLPNITTYPPCTRG